MKKLILSFGALLLAMTSLVAQIPNTSYVGGYILDGSGLTAKSAAMLTTNTGYAGATSEGALYGPLFATLTTGQTLAVTTKPIPISKGNSAVDIVTSMVATNASTADVVLTFKLSTDGSTLWTTPTITVTNVLNGTTPVVSGKTIGLVPKSWAGIASYTNMVFYNELQNAKYLHLVSIKNGHNATITAGPFQYGQWK